MFSKKKKNEERDTFRWSEQSSLTDNRQQTLQVLITSIAKNITMILMAYKNGFKDGYQRRLHIV